MIRRWLQIFTLLWGVQLYAQNIDLYLILLEKGRINEVKDNLPELLTRYPDEAGVHFLKAIVNENGDSSLAQFQDIVKNYPESEFAPKSEMKIGEYLFSRGLYSQASIQFKTVIYKYQQGDHHQRAMELMTNSYFATGQEDSAKATLRTIKKLYPSLNFSQYELSGLESTPRETRLVKLDPNTTSKKIKSAKVRRKRMVPKLLSKPWVIQVGAFGKYENANRLKKQIQGHGYATEVHTVNSNGKRLHAVRIVRFQSKQSAEKIGRKIKKKLGLDFRTINNPE